jgi:exonuclease 3'-5' domain-containing protein 1
LENEAFSTVNTDGKSPKFILESPVILKVLFHVRQDLDTLLSLYGISIDGVRDVQPMELRTRKGPKVFLASLDKCVEKDSAISATEEKAWKFSKGNTRRLFDPALEGNTRYSMSVLFDRLFPNTALEM